MQAKSFDHPLRHSKYVHSRVLLILQPFVERLQVDLFGLLCGETRSRNSTLVVAFGDQAHGEWTLVVLLKKLISVRFRVPRKIV